MHPASVISNAPPPLYSSAPVAAEITPAFPGPLLSALAFTATKWYTTVSRIASDPSTFARLYSVSWLIIFCFFVPPREWHTSVNHYEKHQRTKKTTPNRVGGMR